MTRSSRPLVRVASLGLTVLVALGALVLSTPRPAGAAGVTTHAWMAAQAIDQVTSPQLKTLLKANKAYVRVGAHFPDSGYALSNKYGEEAHWQRFHDAYAAQILTHDECTDLTLPTGPCAPMVAFLMGMIGHGIGDEVWDWLFEPYVADLEEYYTPDSLGGYATEGGAETQLDLVAIADFGQPTTPMVPFPSHPDILEAFAAVGFTEVDEDALNLGQLAMGVVHQAEAAWAPDHIDALHEAMPWTSHNMVTAPGGVDFAATAIAGSWNSMWGRLLGNQPATSVSITYPADGGRRIPATGWNRDHQPGSARGRGGARTRIAAVLTYARPYDGSSGMVSTQLPPGSMTLVERDTSEAVPIMAGWPRSVPYGPDAGEHMVDIQPAGDLKPCTWYRAGVTANLVDARNLAVTPMTWDFRTGTDGAGNRCPDDPYRADEKFLRKVTTDLLGRSATEGQLQAANYQFERGRTRRTHTATILASTEERQRLVTQSFQRYLGRAPDPSGLTYWANKLKTITVPDLSARLLGSDEVYRRAGSTNSGYVAALYPLVHGREVDPSGHAYWTSKLDRGLDRGKLAKVLLTSHESARRTVAQSYQDLLGRAPDPGGWTYWTTILQRAGDPRTLWLSLISSAEYDRKAQAA
ncbi:DUF4214 domain-containing protein [Aquihabitans daechungensis]|uniref:DUF4214 domain-containing protein n=1 Tax=Aquihabitans daechungensis TaxID=1052257 RepID=UPI003B9E8022